MLKKNLESFLLIVITILGFAIRLSFFKTGNFPLHDGGFFYVLVRDLINNNFKLPLFSTYNNANIPFVYPPFGIYIVGIIESITGADLLTLFKVIPLIFATLTIPAFYFLSLLILKDKWSSLSATIVFSLLPMQFAWLILGGGVTRALGSLLSIFALIFVIRFINSGKRQDGIPAIVFNGFTVLSHPEWAWFLFFSIGLFCIIKLIAREKCVIPRTIILLTGTFALIFPWLIVIFISHGWNVFFPLLDSGFSRWNEILNFVLLIWTNEPFFPVFTLFALIGLSSFINKRDYFLVIWLPLVYILQGRAADQKGVIPIALLAGAGIKAIFDQIKIRLTTKNREWLLVAVISGLLFYSLNGNLVVVAPLAKPLPEKILTGIEWIRSETPLDSTFIVISGKAWPEDNYSEWIIALTSRESISVVQGYEWLPGFSGRILEYNQLQYEYSLGMSDLITWMNDNNIRTDYLIFPKTDQYEGNNWVGEAAIHWNDAKLYPGVKTVFENENILIIKLPNVFGNLTN